MSHRSKTQGNMKEFQQNFAVSSKMQGNMNEFQQNPDVSSIKSARKHEGISANKRRLVDTCSAATRRSLPFTHRLLHQKHGETRRNFSSARDVSHASNDMWATLSGLFRYLLIPRHTGPPKARRRAAISWLTRTQKSLLPLPTNIAT